MVPKSTIQFSEQSDSYVWFLSNAICVFKSENSDHTKLWYHIMWQLIMMSHGRNITADSSMKKKN